MGSKCDLNITEWKVRIEEAKELAQKYNSQLYMVSALKDIGIDDAFNSLADLYSDKISLTQGINENEDNKNANDTEGKKKKRHLKLKLHLFKKDQQCKHQ